MWGKLSWGEFSLGRVILGRIVFVVSCHVSWPLSPIGRIQILTYLIWGFLGAAIFDCIIRSCDLFYWFIRTCLGPTVVPATITSLELVCVLTMCFFSDNVSSKENIKILWLIFMFYYGDIIAIKNSHWFFSFT